MTISFAPLTVAIGDLVPHPANVRSNAPETYDPENIAHLKASIAVLGLLQPILVQKFGGKYAVLAGGRRHAALKELVADKAIKGFTAKTKFIAWRFQAVTKVCLDSETRRPVGDTQRSDVCCSVHDCSTETFVAHPVCDQPLIEVVRLPNIKRLQQAKGAAANNHIHARGTDKDRAM
nr:ParB N-terminal domain-containing protein [Rhodobacter kunshanensis]